MMQTIIVTYLVILFYFFFLFMAVYASEKSKNGNLYDILYCNGETGALLLRMVAGIFFMGMGIIQIYILRFEPNRSISWLYTENEPVIWMLISLFAIFLGMRHGIQEATKNESRPHRFTFSGAISFLFIRTLFLIIYEFFFRGILLFVMVKDFGTVAAILLNISLYVLIHWFNKKERWGSIIMGAILCWVTLLYQSVWPAVFIHLSLALSYELVLLLKNRSPFKKIRI